MVGKGLEDPSQTSQLRYPEALMRPRFGVEYGGGVVI